MEHEPCHRRGTRLQAVTRRSASGSGPSAAARHPLAVTSKERPWVELQAEKAEIQHLEVKSVVGTRIEIPKVDAKNLAELHATANYLGVASAFDGGRQLRHAALIDPDVMERDIGISKRPRIVLGSLPRSKQLDLHVARVSERHLQPASSPPHTALDPVGCRDVARVNEGTCALGLGASNTTCDVAASDPILLRKPEPQPKEEVSREPFLDARHTEVA